MEFGRPAVRLNARSTRHGLTDPRTQFARRRPRRRPRGFASGVALHDLYYVRSSRDRAGLAATAALLWAIISALGHTALTAEFDLAGITGIIVSIGITVDMLHRVFRTIERRGRAGRSVRTSR